MFCKWQAICMCYCSIYALCVGFHGNQQLVNNLKFDDIILTTASYGTLGGECHNHSKKLVMIES